MKKLLLFSILFLTCSLGLMNAKADDSLFYDEPLVIEKNIFDSETYNLADCDKIYGLSYYRFRELYPDNYESLVSFLEENEYHYVFGANGLLYWKEDDLEYLVVARSDSDGPGIMGGLYNPSRIKVYKAYYNASISGSNISSNLSNTSDKFITSYGNIFYQRRSSNTNINGYNPNFYEYGVVFDTNVGIRFDTDYYVENVNPPTGYKFYHSIVVNGKTYHSGSYVYSTSSKVSNPKISLKYLTTTGDDTGAKIGATVSVDFNVFDKSRYSYLISFDNGNSWDGLTPRMTSSVYTFSKLENFQVLAQLYDSETGKSYYSTLLVDSIDTSYHSKWITFERDTQYDKYTTIDGKNYLVSTTVYIYQDFNKVNGFPLQLYYSYDGENWSQIPKNDSIYLVFNKNRVIYFMYMDVANQVVFRSTHTFSYFNDTELLGETINFSEECNDSSCNIDVDFVNYTNSHSYWVKSEQEQYKEIDIVKRNGRYSWLTEKENIFCAKITEKENSSKVIQEKCYMSYGVESSFVPSVGGIISGIGDSIAEFMNAIRMFFLGLPMGIKNLITLIFFINLAILLIKVLL